MKIRQTVVASIIALAGLASAPAYADNIGLGTWYDVGFGDVPPGGVVPSALFGPGYSIGFDAPGGAPTAFAPTGTSWTITLSAPGSVTFVDTETSGDQFEIFVNGNSVGDTSVPNVFGSCCNGNDIGLALADSNFSRGTFALAAGTNVISGNFLGAVGLGDADFEVISAVPEPATWAMFLIGFGSIGFALRNRRKGVAATA